ncbi:MAG: FCD domain-containing protein [Burkholderiaceae bacterium]
MSTAERVTDGADVGRLDEQVHTRLVAAGGSREMTRVHHEITARVRIIRRLDFTKPARVAASCDEHAGVLRAITRRHADEAVSLLKAHGEQSKLALRPISLDTLHRARQKCVQA